VQKEVVKGYGYQHGAESVCAFPHVEKVGTGTAVGVFDDAHGELTVLEEIDFKASHFALLVVEAFFRKFDSAKKSAFDNESFVFGNVDLSRSLFEDKRADDRFVVVAVAQYIAVRGLLSRAYDITRRVANGNAGRFSFCKLGDRKSHHYHRKPS
jgi:hypothetical protein